MAERAKFVQIAGSQENGIARLFALDADGEVWEYEGLYMGWSRLNRERVGDAAPSSRAEGGT